VAVGNQMAVASRCPQRFCLAASISRSTSRSVRYSRLRLPTVTFTEVGAPSRSRAFSMEIAPLPIRTVTNLAERVTDCQRTAKIGCEHRQHCLVPWSLKWPCLVLAQQTSLVRFSWLGSLCGLLLIANRPGGLANSIQASLDTTVWPARS
jgi:hypothetical protein